MSTDQETNANDRVDERIIWHERQRVDWVGEQVRDDQIYIFATRTRDWLSMTGTCATPILTQITLTIARLLIWVLVVLPCPETCASEGNERVEMSKPKLQMGAR